ncbi:lipoprotein N-acyltransferase Lnb domain-containing protein [Telluribacter humicola]|uniref:lipoprotein N-acyltransferase Lnb domain-containing protein n=1 Tax=Telluribacter humicola TaxID=1720261 RepID=UPI00286D8EEE|nr:DUF4105 domain-containing protein [Telluribacter humicola]
MSKPSRQGIAQSLFYLSLVVGVLGLGNHHSFSQQLSPAARVSLITYGPGDDDISSAFGHTEIRIVDPIFGIDQNYSYGGFNYRADWFILKFIQGTLLYYIDIHNINRVAYYYQQANRSIQEQALNLSPSQRQQLFAALEENYLPQNRYYRYKFYYDNCATRPRDMIAQACGDSLTIPSRSRMTGKSYRDWMNDYLTGKPWYQLGMNLALGYPSDEQTDGWQAMYLPDQLSDQLRHATIRQANGQVVPLVQSEPTLFAAEKVVRQPVPFVAEPDVVFTLLSILVIGFTIGRYLRGRRVDRWLDWLLFGVSGFVGWFLVVLWLIRDDGVTAWNPTLLYLLPLHVPLVYWATGTTTTSKGRATYFGITAGFILLGMYLSNIPGWFDVVYPLMLLVRCLVNCQPIPVNHQTPIQVY